MVNDALLSDKDSVVLVVYLILRLETPRMSYMSTSFFDTGLIGLDIPDLVQPVIRSDSQPYEGY